MPMKLKEKIYHSMATMNNQELWLLYEQIQLIQHLKQSRPTGKPVMSIEDILTMTSSSTGSWSDTVQEERMERV
jgi:hypothetical protein